MGASSPELLEVLLDRSFAEVLHHVACVITAPLSENGSQAPPKGEKRPAGDPAAAPAKRERSESEAWKVVGRAGQGMDLKTGGGFPDQVTGSGKEPSDLSLALRQSWSSDTGRCVDASPVLLVHGGTGRTTVFIGSHSHRFQALDLAGGGCLWERVLGDRVESSAAVSLCGSLVAVGQARLFTGRWSSEDLVFICFRVFARLLRRLRLFPVRLIWEDPVDVSDWRRSEEQPSCGSPHWSAGRGVT